MDRGAWWAAVHGAAQSRTRLKRLSMHAFIGEGNGNPLQYSCLEDPVDRGAWWAAVHRVAQTRLKRLSSSSSNIIRSLHPCPWEGWVLVLILSALKHHVCIQVLSIYIHFNTYVPFMFGILFLR